MKDLHVLYEQILQLKVDVRDLHNVLSGVDLNKEINETWRNSGDILQIKDVQMTKLDGKSQTIKKIEKLKEEDCTDKR